MTQHIFNFEIQNTIKTRTFDGTHSFERHTFDKILSLRIL